MIVKSGTSSLHPLDTNIYGIRSSYSPSLSIRSTISSPPSRSMPLPTSVNVVDPRYLNLSTREPVTTVLTPTDFSPLPSLGLKDEEHIFAPATAAAPASQQYSLTYSLKETQSVIPPFEQFLESDSEGAFDPFVAFNTSDNVVFNGDKRDRVISLWDEGEFVSETFKDIGEENSFIATSFLSPPQSTSSPAAEERKPKKAGPVKLKKAGAKGDLEYANINMISGSVSGRASGEKQSDSSQAPASISQSQTSSNDGHVLTSNSDAPGQTPRAPVNRHGPKQSLAEDPFKTFVCTQCSRPFRRPEHLRRHYRSLHTHDKPFKCNECGKKFSRSDNLATHARTHGSVTTSCRSSNTANTPRTYATTRKTIQSSHPREMARRR